MCVVCYTVVLQLSVYQYWYLEGTYCHKVAQGRESLSDSARIVHQLVSVRSSRMLRTLAVSNRVRIEQHSVLSVVLRVFHRCKPTTAPVDVAATSSSTLQYCLPPCHTRHEHPFAQVNTCSKFGPTMTSYAPDSAPHVVQRLLSVGQTVNLNFQGDSQGKAWPLEPWPESRAPSLYIVHTVHACYNELWDRA